MPKAPSKDLFKLVKSLSLPEKSYIKNRVRKDEQESAHYYKILDLIDSQADYDEAEVMLKLKIASLNAFAKQKGYLYSIILKRLEEFHSEESRETEANHLLLQVKILQDKLLFDQAEKLLEKVKRLANEYELLLVNQSVLLRELILMRSKKEYNKVDEAGYKNCVVEMGRKADNFLMYNLYGTQLEYLAQQFIVTRNPEQYKKVTLLLNLPYFSDENFALSGRSKRMHYLIRSKLLSMTGDQEEAYLVMSKYVDFLEKEKSGNESYFQNYFVAIHNKIVFELKLKKYSNASKSLLEFETHLKMAGSEMSGQVLLHSHIKFHMSQFSFNFLNGRFKESLLLIDNIKIDLSIQKIGLIYFVLIRFHFVMVYFGVGNFKTAGKYISEILNVSDTNELMASYSGMVKIIQLIVYYEMNKQDILPYTIRSTYRFLLKRKKLFKTEDAILKFIRNKLPKANSSKELIGYFKELKTELEKIIQDPHEATFLDYFDFIVWLESKIEKKPMSELLKERAKLVIS